MGVTPTGIRLLVYRPGKANIADALSKTCGVLTDLLSDHYPVYCVLKKKREKIIKEWKCIRQYQNFDNDIFRTLCKDVNWLDYDQSDNVDVIWDLFLFKITTILEVMCPYKQVYVRARKTPWITPDIIYYMNERSKFIKIF